ncbi:MAG: tRNA (adenosine(37)-N6)-threonylcarbamoyltransferase complex ATPase subunit type 1 TsaE [Candidatus Levybacteria bacterium]|nr:tRNA (adenosine(37)-N6)-threonylcarbamoyltransferase complex ATPase subunit type 1 TsaE [Candidatus Levybacteria bacterium]
MEKRITKSVDETQELARKIAKSTKNGAIFALYGDLGSGKTTFVQGFAQALGVSQRIISPTFIIMRMYEMEGEEKNSSNFYHIDLYRTETMQDIEGLGLKEIMEDKDNIVIIEWPEKMENLLPKHTKRIYFKYINEKEREILGDFNLSS